MFSNFLKIVTYELNTHITTAFWFSGQTFSDRINVYFTEAFCWFEKKTKNFTTTKNGKNKHLSKEIEFYHLAE